MSQKNIGYIICETASVQNPKSRIIGEYAKDRPIIETILQDVNTTNRNGRYYSSSELIPQLSDPRLTELLRTGNLHGEAGHPESKDLARQQNIDPRNMSHKILKIWTECNNIVSHVRASDLNVGDEFNRYILGGAMPSFSLRALGSVVQTRNGAEVKNIRIVTWDWVIYPSHEKAYMTGFANINESGAIHEGSSLILTASDPGIFTPIYSEQVKDYIKDKSMNYKSIVESFGIIAESIKYNPKTNRVNIKGIGGEQFSIHLENHIKQEIMDHCYDLNNRFESRR